MCMAAATLILWSFPHVFASVMTALIAVFLFSGHFGWDSLIGIVMMLVSWSVSTRCRARFSMYYICTLGSVVLAACVIRFYGTANANWIVGLFISRFSPSLYFWLMGIMIRQRENKLAILSEKAELAGTLERNRIAREMNDIIAHNLSGVIALADGARYSAVRNPQVAVDTLEVISETSRDALHQIRGLLSVLREGEGRDRHSAPGVTDISALVSDARRNGLELMVTGLDSLPDDLPPLLQFTLYRTVQELLTNMLKYSSTRTGSIRVEKVGRTISLYSRNPTEDGDSPGGLGLVGMQERLHTQGGVLEVERKDGDFLVKVQVVA